MQNYHLGPSSCPWSYKSSATLHASSLYLVQAQKHLNPLFMNPHEKAQACFQYVNMTRYSEKNR